MTLYGHNGKMDIKIYIKKTEMIRMKKRGRTIRATKKTSELNVYNHYLNARYQVLTVHRTRPLFK